MLLLAGTYDTAASRLTLPRLLAAGVLGTLADLAAFITGFVGGWAIYLDEASHTDFRMDEFAGPIIGGLPVALFFAWASTRLLAARPPAPS